MLQQPGQEEYAGYHTIELEEPVVLEAGKKFCVVAELTNPEYGQPLAVEAFHDRNGKENFPEIANEGESFIYDPVEAEWYTTAFDFDVQYGPSPEDTIPVFLGSVCIKAFTNPLPETPLPLGTAPASAVRFSEMSGPVADGTMLELAAPGEDLPADDPAHIKEIHYSLNGGPDTVYTGPIRLHVASGDVTVSAYAENTDGNKSRTVSKTYSYAAAQLSDWAFYTEEGGIHLDTTDPTPDTLFFPNYVDEVGIMGQTSDDIIYAGRYVESGEKMWELIHPGENGMSMTATLRARQPDGSYLTKNDTEYSVTVSRSPLFIDYIKETAHPDNGVYNTYTFYYKDGEEFKPLADLPTSGSGEIDISSIIPTGTELELEYTENDWQDRHSDKLPGRASLPAGLEIDTETETYRVSFANPFRYADNEDMQGAVIGKPGDKLPAVPGQTIYVQRLATDKKFASSIGCYTAPDRPVAEAQIESVTADTVTLKTVQGALYKMDSGEWQESPVFEGLTFAQEHTFSVFIPAGEDNYASETATVCVSAVDPAKYSFTVKYEDTDGKIIGTKTVPFAAAGKFSRENVSLPEGYQQVLPAHPGDDWLYPTALSFLNGKWTVTEPTVYVTAEPLAKGTVTVQKADGTVLRTDTKYYAEGSFTETVKAPAGYHFDGSDKFTVKVSRSANGRLKADAPTFKFTVLPDKTIVESKPLTAVPDSLQKTSFNSVEKITAALKEAAMKKLPQDVKKGAEKTVIFDVQLMITENGVTRPATAEELAARGSIPVVLPYPEGTNAEGYRFAVAHMITMDTGGLHSGDIETPEAAAMADGLHVTLQGLSPVMIAYSPVKDASPATGDGGQTALWTGLSFASAVGAAYVIACGRKKEKAR